MKSLNRILRRVCVVGAASERGSVARLLFEFRSLGWVAVEQNEFLAADVFWVVLPEQWRNANPKTRAFVGSVSDNLLRFFAESKAGLLVATGDNEPVKCLPPWSMGARGIMCNTTHDGVFDVVIERTMGKPMAMLKKAHGGGMVQVEQHVIT